VGEEDRISFADMPFFSLSFLRYFARISSEVGEVGEVGEAAGEGFGLGFGV
jgi:hypothetical protein